LGSQKIFVELNQYKELSITYEKVPLDTLVIYTAYRLVKDQYPLTYENIVALAFTLFPKRFSLRGYPQYPDSATINKSWLRCRTDKNWLNGSAKAGFKLTDLGRMAAEKFEETQEVSDRIQEKNQDVDYRGQKLIEGLRKTAIFQDWLKSNTVQFHISEFLLVLHCTMSSPFEVKHQRLETFRMYAKAMEDAEVVTFLNSCEEEFKTVFQPPTVTKAKGGMMKKK
jgi:hypothetical protein